MLIDGVLKDPMAFGWPQSQPVADYAMLPELIARFRLHIGLAIAFVLAAVVYLIQSRTVFGMQSCVPPPGKSSARRRRRSSAAN